MCAIMASRSSTTFIAMSSDRYSSVQSVSVAGTMPGSSPWMVTPLHLQRLRDLRQRVRGYGLVNEHRSRPCCTRWVGGSWR